MIQKMKKLTFLVYHREYEDFLHRLQDLGVMHVVTGEVDSRQSETISGYVEQIRQLTALQKDMKALLADSKLKVEKTESTDTGEQTPDIPRLTERFERLAELRRLEAEQTTQLLQLEPWGDFDPADVQKKMQAAGCELQFYVAPTKVYNKQIANEYPVVAVSEAKKNTYFALVAREGQAEIPATRLTLPSVSQHQLQAQQTAIFQELNQEIESLTKLSQENLPQVEATLRVLNAKMQFDTVKEGIRT